MKLLHVEIRECRECPYRMAAWRPKSSGRRKGIPYVCGGLKSVPEVPDSGVTLVVPAA
jgi:hypothetical protein